MQRSFVKEWLYQLLPAWAASLTAPILLALPSLSNAPFLQAYLFFLILAAPVYLMLGAPLSAMVEWLKRRMNWRGVRSYWFSLPIYAAIGAAAMYAYLLTVLKELQVHTSPDLFGLLAIGAAAALYMYHLSLAIAALLKRKSRA